MCSYKEARYYDSDVARFLSLDPKARDYPSLSDYCYVAGNPLIFVDSDGKDIRIYYKDTDGNQQSIKINKVDDKSLDNLVTQSGNNQFVSQFVDAVKYAREGDKKGLFEKMAKRKKVVAVYEAQVSEYLEGAYTEEGSEDGKIAWNPKNGTALYDKTENPTGEVSSPAVGLLHEFGHANIVLYKPVLEALIAFFTLDEEKIVTRTVENPAQKKLDEPVRKDYYRGRTKKVPNVEYHENNQDSFK